MCERMKKDCIKKSHVTVFITVLMLLTFCFLFAKPASIFAATDVPGRTTIQDISTPAFGQVKLTWKKADNATDYHIYYKEKKAGKWTKLASVKAGTTSYTHKASAKYPLTTGRSYAYTVKAYNSASKKYGAYNKRGIMIQILPETVKLNKAEVNSDKISVNLSWSKAGGCDSYEIYRRTYRSSWKRIARVKSNTLKYKDTTPVRGWANYYAVCGYDSKTKTTGNRSNILLAVLDSPQFTFPTVRDAYVDVLRAVKAGDKIGMIEPMPYGTVNLEYFVFDMNNDSIPELIVGSDCPWEEGDKTYTRKICQLYTCEKTGSGYKSKRMSGYFWDPQMSEKHDYLYENYYWYAKSVNFKYRWFIDKEDNILKHYSEPLNYKVGSKELIDFDSRNKKPSWTKITDTSALSGL